MSDQTVVMAKRYGFRYTRKDLILYALSIGMGDDDDDDEGHASNKTVTDKDAGKDDELRFLYERHPQFSPLPIFCLTFLFWSNKSIHQQESGRIPPFPPPLMAQAEIIPRQFLKADIVDNQDLSSYPLIHMWQSIIWDRNLPLIAEADPNGAAVETTIHSKTISVEPKSVGTFVTTQSQVMTTMPDPASATKDKLSLLCTLQSTTLVLGLSKDKVTPYNSSGIAKLTSRPIIPKDSSPPLFEWTYATRSNQALLYRIASGDSNRIHVDTSVSERMGSDKKAPLLHGLFSLGVAFRAILKLVPDADRRIARLEAKFTQPAFVGDVLSVKIWKRATSSSAADLLFVVTNKETGVTLVDCGCAEFRGEDGLPIADKTIGSSRVGGLSRL